MKTAPITLIAALCILSTACNGGPFSPTTTPTITPAPISPPATMETLEACGFSIVHPPDFVPDGQGYQVMFQATADPYVWALIQLRHRETSEAGLPLLSLAINLQNLYFPQMGSDMIFDPLTVTDIQGNTLRGLQKDVIQDELHTRLITILRPNSLLLPAVSLSGAQAAQPPPPTPTPYFLPYQLLATFTVDIPECYGKVSILKRDGCLATRRLAQPCRPSKPSGPAPSAPSSSPWPPTPG